MFNKEETQFLIAAVDEAVKRGGLNVASMSISVAMKLQQAAAEDAKPAPPSLPAKEKAKEKLRPNEVN